MSASLSAHAVWSTGASTSTNPALLVVDLNPGCGEAARLRAILKSAERPAFRIFEERPPPEQLAELPRHLQPIISRIDPSVVILVMLPGLLGAVSELLKSVTDAGVRSAFVPVVDGSAPSDLRRLLYVGAADFITPPVSPSDVLPRLWRLVGAAGPRPIAKQLRARCGLQQLIGRNPAFVAEVSKIPRLASCDVSVLISGETGTGKELFSRAIHYVSPRSGRAFVPVNCGAIPTELAEAELFGHERGAFTGAVTARPGLITDAEGGTLFLDEIDCLPAAVQVKLLRFLQDKEYRLLGSGRVHRANVRMIAATNSDLGEALESGRFRRDLYYRLNVVSLKLPPLRDRAEDIPLLARHLLAKHAVELHKGAMEFSPGALRRLLLHDWPGNVRELENVIESAVVLSQQSVLLESEIVLPASGPLAEAESFQEAKARIVAGFERTYVENLLTLHRGNISVAARAARKNRRAFWELLRKHAIDADRFRKYL